MAEESGFVQGMRLSPAEIDVLERYIGVMEQADRNRVDFASSGTVAFTPGALLVVAVAKFVYDVYQDYGAVALTAEDFQQHFKSVARELAKLEAAGEVSPSVSTLSKLRRDLTAARRSGGL